MLVVDISRGGPSIEERGRRAESSIARAAAILSNIWYHIFHRHGVWLRPPCSRWASVAATGAAIIFPTRLLWETLGAITTVR